MKTALAFFAATALVASAFAVDSRPIAVGVCAHVTRDEFDERERTFAAAARLGFDLVRSDFDWARCRPDPARPFDFSAYDAVADAAAGHGIRILPILGAPPDRARPVKDHLTEWREFVAAFAEHFKGRVREVEIWNEENIAVFWPDPDPVAYAKTLRAAYEEIRRAAPEMRVVFGGTAGVDTDFIDRALAAGALGAFDVMAVHPYTHPLAPDGELEKRVAALRGTLAKHGIGDIPVWFTEIGWPTRKATMPDEAAFKAALALMFPEHRALRAIYVDPELPGSAAKVFAAAVEACLPEGSRCEPLAAGAANERLKAGGCDIVFFPFGESYPADAFEATAEFVERGGALALVGGFPLYYPHIGGKFAGSCRHGAPEGEAARRRLHLAVRTPWSDKALHERLEVFPAAAIGGGAQGVSANRFLSAGRLAPGERMIPILEGKDREGKSAVAAAIFELANGGRVFVTTRGGSPAVLDEREQADFTVRAIGIAGRLGIERLIIYELRAPERDRADDEHHFGILHEDFSPKPAAEAVRGRLLGN